MDWGWSIGTAIGAVAAGYGALAVNHRGASRVLFLVAAAILAYKIVDWGMSTTISAPLRVLAVGLLGAALATGVVETWRSASVPTPKPEPAKPIQSNTMGDVAANAISPPPADNKKASPALAPARVPHQRFKPVEPVPPAPAPAPNAAPAPNPEPAEQAKTQERTAILRQLTNLYILSHDGITPRMAAGLELPPAEFLNEELARQGAKWRVVQVVGPNAQTEEIP